MVSFFFTMKRVLGIGIGILYASVCLAQVVSPDSTHVAYQDSLYVWQVTTMDKSGRLFSVCTYRDSLLQQQVNERYYYSNGALRCEAHYSPKGLLSDTVRCWYSNGRQKRIDVYHEGRCIEGQCFAPNGMVVRYFDYARPVSYVGGTKALYTEIAINASNPDVGVHGTVVVLIDVDVKGRVTDKRIVQSLHPVLDAEVLRICEHLHSFEPAQRDGEAVPGQIVLPLVF